jgi:hypothetical protein
VIRSFDVLRVNGRVVNARSDLGAETSESWEVRAELQDQDDLQYLAGLFAISSEPLDLELEAFDDDLAPPVVGQARIDMGGWALPTQVPCTVRFVGTEPLQTPD